jgi:NAD+ synthase (glutamine-hydrolysing)
LVASVGLPLACNGTIFNAVALFVDGVLTGFVAKRHLAGDGIHYEPRWFKPWPAGVVSHVDVDGRQLPVGDIFFEIDGLTIGFEVCEDAWVAERPGINLASHGVDIILNPSASHFAFGKNEIRKRFVVEGSRAFGAAYVYANLLGCEAGRVIYDGDTMIASHGEIVTEGPRFSYRDFTLICATVDVDRNRLIRHRRASFRPEFHDEGRRILVKNFEIPRGGIAARDASHTWERGENVKHEEFCRAVSLGLFDYLRKSKNHGFVVSLSGGVDSSSASCLVAMMVRAAVKELGLRGFKEKLDYIPWMKNASSEAEIIERILACVYQGTENSSDITRNAAKRLAEEVGATFYDLDISSLVDGYEQLISKATGVQLSWKEHDLALQNIQARVRSPSVWLIANIRRALLLSTSNRSEAAVGYTTMDGDSSGGLSPLGGIDKAYLRTWLVWLEQIGPEGIGNYPSLRFVNAQQPTAELRPLNDKQTDEGDLMPYVVLDKIERFAIRDKMLPEEVVSALEQTFNGSYSRASLESWTVKFFKLWSASQWKRERYAPSFHLDDENLDPKTWCRFPILSGGFEEELRPLVNRRTNNGRIVENRLRRAGKKNKEQEVGD